MGDDDGKIEEQLLLVARELKRQSKEQQQVPKFIKVFRSGFTQSLMCIEWDGGTVGRWNGGTVGRWDSWNGGTAGMVG